MTTTSDGKITAGARVILTIEVSRCGSWGAECTVAQVHKQAAETAVDYVRKCVEGDTRLRVIGTRVICVSNEEERS
jgi:hypothetical protein